MIDWTILISGIIGGIIGTYLGAFFIYRKQQERYKNIRKTAVKALKVFKKYQNKAYENASNDFNVSLNLTEKRAILVVLHKIGIPITPKSSGKFNINEIIFAEDTIVSNEIDNMILQIDSGNCDHLFFEDPDEYFSKNIVLKYRRSVALRFVKEVFSKSTCNNSNTEINFPDDWFKKFSVGEIYTLSVFKEKISHIQNIDKSLHKVDSKAVEKLIEEVESGLWDTYLEWMYDVFSNIQSQKAFTQQITMAIAQQPLTHTPSKE